MRRKISLLFIAVSFISGILTAQSKHYTEPEQFKLIDEDPALSYEEALLQKFYFVFDRTKLNSKYSVKSANRPYKCATGLISEYQQNKSLLSAEAVKTVNEYLNRPFNRTAGTEIYVSPSGRFELTYTTEGDHAVPAADSDNSNVPDYIEWIANYFDYSWDYTVDTLGYLAPPIGSGRYQIGFEDMGFYGYTDVVSGKLTRIVMHNNFIGFPENTDPEGDQKGAAKVTAIHEFKHAVQRVYNDWKESGWFIEMDATWMEDIGYDEVNDYYNYLSSSQLIEPSRSFSQGSGYEDCLWLHYITEKYGITANHILWNRRSTNGNESVYNTFDAVLSDLGSSFSQSFTEYFVWNFSTGTRANGLFDTYEEAADYPSALLCGGEQPLPAFSEGCGLNPPSANFLYFKSSDLNKFLKIKFNGDADAEYTIELLVVYKNNTSELLTFNLAPSTDLDYLFTTKLNEIKYAVLIPVLSTVSGSQRNFTADVSPFQTAEFLFTPLLDTENLDARTVSVQVITEYNIAVTDSLKFFYKINDGEFISQSMVPGGNDSEFNAVISPVSSGSTVEYYFTIYDTLGDYTYYPSTAPLESFSYFAGPDIRIPSLNHTAKSGFNKYNFPLILYASSADNLGIDSLYAEYRINNGTLFKIDFEPIKDSLYSGVINIDPSQLNTGDKFEYRLASVDVSGNHNKKYFPEEGFESYILTEGYSYSSAPIKEIKAGSVMRDTIEVTDNFIIKDLNIALKFRHNRISDLSLRIIPPFRSITPLFTRPGLESEYAEANDPDIILDQEALEEFGNFAPQLYNPLYGEFRPDTTNLDYFNGYNAKGKWIITMIDYVSDESGTMDEWKLIFSGDKTTDIVSEDFIPDYFSLSQNYPNPFNPETKIRFSIAQHTFASLKIYDIIGNEVAVLVNGELSPGSYEFIFDALKNNLASGFYFYRLQTDQFNSTRKMLLLK